MMNRRADRRDKQVDGLLRVHAWSPGGFLNAGLLTLAEDGQSIAASFEYDQAYLSAPGAYPLDPLNLPLGRTVQASHSQFVRLGAIFDAAPDAWGRRVVTAQLPEEARQRVFREAFLRGADGIGALVLTPEALTGQIDLERIVALSLAERPGLSQLENASKAAMDFEAGLDLTEDMRAMLGGSWTIGGARPKAILRDDRPGAPAGASLIAKFDSKLDAALPRNRIESACLSMARAMGFAVPRHRLVELSQGRTALVIDRFDRHDLGGTVQRRHYISAMSLASYEPQSSMLSSRQDQAVISWSKLMELTSRTCEHPSAARVEMFARLLLNTALHNTDDHLKNFGFLKSLTSPTQYQIAPVFDVSAQAAQRHYLHCLNLGQVYTLQDVMPMARAMGIAKGAAQEAHDRIIGVLCRRQEFFESAGLSRSQIEEVNRWIDAGCGAHYRQVLQASPAQAIDETDQADVIAPAPQP